MGNYNQNIANNYPEVIGTAFCTFCNVKRTLFAIYSRPVFIYFRTLSILKNYHSYLFEAPFKCAHALSFYFLICMQASIRPKMIVCIGPLVANYETKPLNECEASSMDCTVHEGTSYIQTAYLTLVHRVLANLFW